MRITTEPDLEARLLVEFLTDARVPDALSFGEVVRNFAANVTSRIRRRTSLGRHAGAPRKSIEAIRKFKGL